MKQVLFVCTGNTFRSASAEYLLRKYLEDQHDGSFTVASAGTKGNPYGMYDSMISTVKKHGVDPSAHRYRVLSEKIVKEADIIICFTRQHADFVQRNFDRRSYLFNYLVSGAKTDLTDDDEAHGTYSDLDLFVEQRVHLIADSIPDLYASLKRM